MFKKGCSSRSGLVWSLGLKFTIGLLEKLTMSKVLLNFELWKFYHNPSPFSWRPMDETSIRSLSRKPDCRGPSFPATWLSPWKSKMWSTRCSWSTPISHPKWTQGWFCTFLCEFLTVKILMKFLLINFVDLSSYWNLSTSSSKFCVPGLVPLICLVAAVFVVQLFQSNFTSLLCTTFSKLAIYRAP